MGVVLRIVRGHRLFLRRVASVQHAHNGRRTFRLAVPHLARGPYRLLVSASLIPIANTATTTAGSVPGGNPRGRHDQVDRSSRLTFSLVAGPRGAQPLCPASGPAVEGPEVTQQRLAFAGESVAVGSQLHDPGAA
jgi:hypothetical protein